jgi:hypothetical protein
VTARSRDSRQLYDLVTGALMTLAIEFGVAVVLFVVTIIVAVAILALTT